MADQISKGDEVSWNVRLVESSFTLHEADCVGNAVGLGSAVWYSQGRQD